MAEAAHAEAGAAISPTGSSSLRTSRFARHVEPPLLLFTMAKQNPYPIPAAVGANILRFFLIELLALHLANVPSPHQV